jgi:PhzF family phenazine biosynthesis protein
MTERPYAVLDVFAERPAAGNPLAVVLDGQGLTTEQMQSYANWTNLSETTFLLPPTDPAADYRVRIFTPDQELPFAGHPTLGSCRAWLDAGGRPANPGTVIQECGVGLVTLRAGGEGAEATQAFLAPPLIRSGPLDDALLAKVIDELRIDGSQVQDAAWIDNGPGWIGLLLADAESVLAVRPGPTTEKIGLVGFHRGEGSGHRRGPDDPLYEVRAFFQKNGSTAEDPVTGSLNASVAQWMVETGRATPPYAATQGRAIGREGRIAITAGRDGDGGLWVGGAATVMVRGMVAL